MKYNTTTISAFAATLIVTASTLPQAQAVTIAHGGDSVDIDFVDIGNAGNTADTSGYGAVSYDYSIGTYEVTATQWAAVSSFDANIESGSTLWSGSQPTAQASWYEAAKFANWLTSGNALLGAYQFSDATTFTGVDRDVALATYMTIYVLPSEDEWYKAAYFKSDGSGYTLYPTGDGEPVGGTDTRYNALYSSPWEVGSGSVENNGTYDMGGNVWEWNESAFDGTLDSPTEARTRRGGFWRSTPLAVASSYRTSSTPGSEEDWLGFRVASLSVVPEPSSTALLGLGGLALALRRKRS